MARAHGPRGNPSMLVEAPGAKRARRDRRAPACRAPLAQVHIDSDAASTAMAARASDDLRRRVETHRLRIEQRRAEGRRDSVHLR